MEANLQHLRAVTTCNKFHCSAQRRRYVLLSMVALCAFYQPNTSRPSQLYATCRPDEATLLNVCWVCVHPYAIHKQEDNNAVVMHNGRLGVVGTHSSHQAHPSEKQLNVSLSLV